MTPTESKTALVPATEGDARRDALLRAVGFDRLSEAQRELALSISDRYDLDVMLRHLVMVDGKPYITRDGLLHVAHKSGDFDGIEVDQPVLDPDGKYWRTVCRVYRKSFSRPFVYPGRYPAIGGNQKYNEEMSIKVAEVMTLRRAFDVSAPVIEERWDGEIDDAIETPAPTSLAERVAQRALAASASATQPETGASASDGVADETPETPAPLAVVIDPEEAEFIQAFADSTEPDEEDALTADEVVGQALMGIVEGIDDLADEVEDEPDVPAVVSPLREPETRPSEMFVAPAEGFGADPTSALSQFKVWAKDHDTTLLRQVARELFPNASGFKDLNAQELGVIQHEVAKAEMKRDEASASERCAAPSPLSNNKCTLDPGHKGPHRHGTRETWDQ